jgi:hypothetical protein
VCWGREKIMGAGKVSPTFSQSASALVQAEGLWCLQVRVQQAVESAQGVLADTHDGFGASRGVSCPLVDLGNGGVLDRLLTTSMPKRRKIWTYLTQERTPTNVKGNYYYTSRALGSYSLGFSCGLAATTAGRRGLVLSPGAPPPWTSRASTGAVNFPRASQCVVCAFLYHR